MNERTCFNLILLSEPFSLAEINGSTSCVKKTIFEPKNLVVRNIFAKKARGKVMTLKNDISRKNHDFVFMLNHRLLTDVDATAVRAYVCVRLLLCMSISLQGWVSYM